MDGMGIPAKKKNAIPQDDALCAYPNLPYCNLKKKRTAAQVAGTPLACPIVM